jgi:hypothetical protein
MRRFNGKFVYQPMKNELGSPKVKGPFLSALAADATNKLAALGMCVDVKYELQYGGLLKN